MTMDDVYEYALSKFGCAYEYGGSGPNRRGGFGYDCSGLVEDILAYAGSPLPYDMTADEQMNYFKAQHAPERKCRGALAFFGTEDKIVHVGWMIDDKVILSAAGGGAHCRTLAMSLRQQAYVKLQPWKYYKWPAFVTALLPAYPKLLSQ